MTVYISNVMQKFQRYHPSKSQHSPFHVAPYALLKKGERQHDFETDASPSLDAIENIHILKKMVAFFIMAT